MRYAFLENPKTALGRLVSGAWRKFREWWDEHKKEIAEESRRKIFHTKQRGPELD